MHYLLNIFYLLTWDIRHRNINFAICPCTLDSHHKQILGIFLLQSKFYRQKPVISIFCIDVLQTKLYFDLKRCSQMISSIDHSPSIPHEVRQQQSYPSLKSRAKTEAGATKAGKMIENQQQIFFPQKKFSQMIRTYIYSIGKDYNIISMFEKSNQIIRKRKYSRISLKKRQELVDLVINGGISLSRSAKKLNLKLSTAKLIIRKFKEAGKFYFRTFRHPRHCQSKLQQQCKELYQTFRKQNMEQQDQPQADCYTFYTPVVCYPQYQLIQAPLALYYFWNPFSQLVQ